jgi:succinylarginine dihydrolase
MTKDLIEVNFDGLVGPTHHFGGLGPGNLASEKHAGAISRPRAAALQGLDKIARVADFADPEQFRCAVLPPHVCPRLDWLRQVGFSGSTDQMLSSAAVQAPELLRAAWSASAMWTANGATVCSPTDSADGRTHLTPANLFSSHHRALEAEETARVLRLVFSNHSEFQVHAALRGGWPLRDEGAANHMRLSDSSGRLGIDVFVSGGEQASGRFISRQSRLASEAIARLHQLDPAAVCFLQQDQRAIDAGAFHNDVVATSHRGLLIYHQAAYQDADREITRLKLQYQQRTGEDLCAIEISEQQLSLADAVESYLFNSQLIPLVDGTLMMLCPLQCMENKAAKTAVAGLVGKHTNISTIQSIDLRESMHNGGGPACLRLRVPLSRNAYDSLPPGILWTKRLENQLREFIHEQYRTEINWRDLQSADFAAEARQVASRVRQILGFPD